MVLRPTQNIHRNKNASVDPQACSFVLNFGGHLSLDKLLDVLDRADPDLARGIVNVLLGTPGYGFTQHFLALAEHPGVARLAAYSQSGKVGTGGSQRRDAVSTVALSQLLDMYQSSWVSTWLLVTS